MAAAGTVTRMDAPCDARARPLADSTLSAAAPLRVFSRHPPGHSHHDALADGLRGAGARYGTWRARSESDGDSETRRRAPPPAPGLTFPPRCRFRRAVPASRGPGTRTALERGGDHRRGPPARRSSGRRCRRCPAEPDFRVNRRAVRVCQGAQRRPGRRPGSGPLPTRRRMGRPAPGLEHTVTPAA
jgi:hypothetical protein